MEKKEKGLGAWQLTMMALGTVIGGSFFLGSAVAVHAAGPSVLIGFVLGGVLVYFILYALSELTVTNPDSGSFRTFAAQAFGEGAGFVVGWVYWTGMILAMSSEATAVSIMARGFFPKLPTTLAGGGIILAVTLVNLLGASRLSKLESALAAVKLFAVVAFVVVAFLLIAGLFPGKAAVGLGELTREPFLPGGITGLAGSMLIVMFTYSGFEIIGLAASEAGQPKETIPKAIRYTVLSLVGLYIVFMLTLLPLIPTGQLNETTSPIVAALGAHGMGWTGTAMNVVLITAILSTMLAAMFGLGRMMRSLADEGMAPVWLRDNTDVPYRGILSSGAAMLLALGLGLLFPRVYLFLISSGGFALLFSYVVIMATHIRIRKRYGCPDGKCQMWGFPYSSWLVLLALIAVIVSMPFVEGQAPGLIAGVAITGFYVLSYLAVRHARRKRNVVRRIKFHTGNAGLATEFSEELSTPEEKMEKTGRKNSQPP